MLRLAVNPRVFVIISWSPKQAFPSFPSSTHTLRTLWRPSSAAVFGADVYMQPAAGAPPGSGPRGVCVMRGEARLSLIMFTSPPLSIHASAPRRACCAAHMIGRSLRGKCPISSTLVRLARLSPGSQADQRLLVAGCYFCQQTALCRWCRPRICNHEITERAPALHAAAMVAALSTGMPHTIRRYGRGAGHACTCPALQDGTCLAPV